MCRFLGDAHVTQPPLEATTLSEHDAGDHTFFIAQVDAVERGPAPSALMYRDRSYHSL